MDLNIPNPDVEVELLEDSWFFRNLLQLPTPSNPRMLRSFSDPCSSSSFPAKSYDDTYQSISKLSSPSPPPPTRNGTKMIQDRGSKSSRNSLARAPSLPTTLDTSQGFHDDEDEDEEEMEFSMGKLIRQASLNYSRARPPRTKTLQSSSLTRQKSDKLMTHESLKDIGNREDRLQGFKDFDKQEKTSSSVDKTTARPPHMSEAPPVPRWGGKKSTEDMKAQIKFWARAVASNVRQEC